MPSNIGLTCQILELLQAKTIRIGTRASQNQAAGKRSVSYPTQLPTGDHPHSEPWTKAHFSFLSTDSEGWEGYLAHWVLSMLTPVWAPAEDQQLHKGSTRVWHQARRHRLLERY